MSTVIAEPRVAPQVGRGELFLAFLQISLSALGGGLVWVRRGVVERRRWLNDAEFAELLGLCQLMPGPNMASLAVCIGYRLRGPGGALWALAGFVLIPWLIALAVGSFLLSHADMPVLRNALGGIAMAAAGLIIGTGIKMLLPHRRRPAALFVAALAFAGLALAKLPLLAVLLGLAPFSVALARLERGRAG